MKLLHVIPSIDPAGGGPIAGIRQLHRPPRERGVDVDVCCGDAADVPFVRGSEMGGPWVRINIDLRKAI